MSMKTIEQTSPVSSSKNKYDSDSDSDHFYDALSRLLVYYYININTAKAELQIRIKIKSEKTIYCLVQKQQKIRKKKNLMHPTKKKHILTL